MFLRYPNNIYFQIKETKKKKKNNSKNGYRKKQKLRSKERNQMRVRKQQQRSFYTSEDRITIHSKVYKYNNESRMLVLTNPDIMNIILSYLPYYSFIMLSSVSRIFNELFKNNMEIFMAKSNINYYKNYRKELLKNPKNMYKWNEQKKSIENIIYRVDDYREIIYKLKWFYNSEFLIIYNNVCNEYGYLNIYNKFLKTYISYKKYTRKMYKCRICKNSKTQCYLCDISNYTLRQIYFYSISPYTIEQYKFLTNSFNN